DGFGGVILTWADDRDGDLDIYAQRISQYGEKMWGENGIVVCNASDTQSNPKIINDDIYGGAYISWIDQRDYYNSGRDIYIMRIRGNGEPYFYWPLNGIVVCNATDDQTNLGMISDGIGYPIMVWRDQRDDPDGDIYAQKVGAYGDPDWDDNGTAICTQEDWQGWAALTSDGSGGAFITWQDDRNGASNDDIFIQYINSAGNIQWDSNGISVCDAIDDQNSPVICSDGSGGSIIAWYDFRDESLTGTDIYAQRFNSTGDSLWKTNGLVISNETDDQFTPRICSDNSGGAVISWTDNRGLNYDIYAQRIDSSGTPIWNDNGTAICTQEDDQQLQRLISDGSGGAIIAWYDDRNQIDFDIYAQMIDSSGNVLWDEYGAAICTESGDQRYHNICTDGSGGAYIVWFDDAGTIDKNNDIYGQKLKNDQKPTSNNPGTVLTTPIGSETIGWVLYDDLGGGDYRVWANNSLGNYYVWVNWSSWGPGYPLNVEINRTKSGIYEYAIEFYDDYDQYGDSNTVIVKILDDPPTSNHPNPITTTKAGTEKIEWELYDDYGGGQYRVLANNTLGTNYVWVDWTSWFTNSTALHIDINRSAPGDFEYTLEYQDNMDQYGNPDKVIVTVVNSAPTSNHPDDMPLHLNESYNIRWELNDDFGAGNYRVLVNGTAGSWTAWTIGVQIQYPPDTTSLGISNYTIQYYDSHGKFGIPDTVIVEVMEEPTNGGGNGGAHQISGYHLYLILLLFTVITVIFSKRQQLKIKKYHQ
ncbi:MAG: hypothetical protein ACFFDH_23335, partial [Promethearchaeota archaeon]